MSKDHHSTMPRSKRFPPPKPRHQIIPAPPNATQVKWYACCEMRQSRDKKPLLTFDCSNATPTCTGWQRPTRWQCLILKGLFYQMSSTLSGYIYIHIYIYIYIHIYICQTSHEESYNASSLLCNGANGHMDIVTFQQKRGIDVKTPPTTPHILPQRSGYATSHVD